MLNGRALIPYPSYSGTLAFEDLWPSIGDYDFNDLVVDYDFNIIKNNQEVVKSINATFIIQAFGAAVHKGFGFTLPKVNPNDVVSVSGYNVLNNAVFNIASNVSLRRNPFLKLK
jgi:LruC domain-containing protein